MHTHMRTHFHIFSEFSSSPVLDSHVATMLQPPEDPAGVSQGLTLLQ